MPSTSLQPDVSTAVAIKRLLRSRIGSDWRPGDRLPPVKQLAQQLGTGESNTYQAVRELARDGFLVSQRRRGTFVADLSKRAPLPSGRHLAGRTVALCTSGHPAKPFIQRMLNSCVETLSGAGAAIQCHSLPDGGEFEYDIDTDALVLFNPPIAEPIRTRPDQILSVVTTTRYVSVGDHQQYDVVGVNEFQGGVLAGRMLRASGCRRPCFVGRQLGLDSTRYDATSTTRLQGFEEGWGEPLSPDSLYHVGGYNMLTGARFFRDFKNLARKHDGMFTASDDIAIGFAIAAGAHGVTLGKDFQLVGFDGQLRSSELGEMSLSTIVVPCEDMGRRAAELLIERFDDPERPIHQLFLDCMANYGTTTHTAPKEPTP